MAVAIGIDLGTTYCCVATYENRQVRIIETQTSENITPSYLTIDDDGNVTAGSAAKNQFHIKPENCLFDIKRIIGRKFNDPQLQQELHRWPFAVIKCENNTPIIGLQSRGQFRPEQITAKLLSYLKVQAEIFLSKTVINAVITVPAYFNNGQRQATKDAAKIAGFEVIKIINEPTAAAIAFNHQHRLFQHWTNILVIDLGGGTFDISILKMKNTEIEVIAVGGDTNLGGEDFDNALVNYCIKEFQKKEGIDLRLGTSSSLEDERRLAHNRLRRLKLRCEMDKISLSTTKRVVVSLDAMYADKPMNDVITRETFEILNKARFDRCIEIMEKVIEDANLDKYQIEEIILVGGSSKIPAIQKMVTDYFEKTPRQNIKCSEAVAYDAAIKASIDFKYEEIPSRTVVRDVCPLSIGIELAVIRGEPENFNRIIRKNTPVPCRRTKRYYTAKKNTTALSINIYEGENSNAKSNFLLGSFIISNLPKDCPQGEMVEVTMELTAEGILNCSAVCPRTSATNYLEILETKRRLSSQEIARMKILEMESTNLFFLD